jgi:hypothetical protein
MTVQLVLAVVGGLDANAVVLIYVVGAIALAAGLLLVAPVFLIVPELRQPSPWLAAPWGAGVALLVGGFFTGVRRLFHWEAAAMYVVVGAAAGLVYAFAARRARPEV